MLSGFLRRIHRGDGKFYGGLKRFAKKLLEFNLTPPAALKGLFRGRL